MEWRKLSLRYTLLMAGLLSSAFVFGQDASELANTARNFMRTGDYANAILVLNQAIQQSPSDPSLKRELGFAYYLKGDMSRAKNVIEPLLDKRDADVQLYQIAGNIYLAREEWKNAEKLYIKGLKKFPDRGELYNDYGQLQQNMRNFDGALHTWVKGIEVDPLFPGNYYNAARSYFYSKDPIWAIIYGETFVNLESYTTRTAEMRDVIIESYKKMFDDPAMFSSIPEAPVKKSKKNNAAGNEFINAFKHSISKQISTVTTGIDPENLIMLRTRFILDWYSMNNEMYPFALFDFQRKLLKDGMFEAYNQWLFGPASNQSEYKAWTSLHKAEYDAFNQYQRNHPFKPRKGEFYDSNTTTIGK
ncbi:TPR repeat protein [Chitinophaga skermanii]|uniref:TPR repeat protein n=1 Tax=Chitinophaga skermanii TaxID=331697 RepID=A0A327R9I1_9BACT|nr:tetratricopeptide repeat protein [Chitinophaga skermanii]RAJ10577.1 TPR repeat protein [Chitinophaga skermanii]